MEAELKDLVRTAPTRWMQGALLQATCQWHTLEGQTHWITCRSTEITCKMRARVTLPIYPIHSNTLPISSNLSLPEDCPNLDALCNAGLPKSTSVWHPQETPQFHPCLKLSSCNTSDPQRKRNETSVRASAEFATSRQRKQNPRETAAHLRERQYAEIFGGQSRCDVPLASQYANCSHPTRRPEYIDLPFPQICILKTLHHQLYRIQWIYIYIYYLFIYIYI